MKMRLVFNGGAVLDVDVEEYRVKRNRFTGELVGLDWTSVDGRPGAVTLKRVDLSQIDAIATVWEEGDRPDRADGSEPEGEPETASEPG